MINQNQFCGGTQDRNDKTMEWVDWVVLADERKMMLYFKVLKRYYEYKTDHIIY